MPRLNAGEKSVQQIAYEKITALKAKYPNKTLVDLAKKAGVNVKYYHNHLTILKKRGEKPPTPKKPTPKDQKIKVKKLQIEAQPESRKMVCLMGTPEQIREALA